MPCDSRSGSKKSSNSHCPQVLPGRTVDSPQPPGSPPPRGGGPSVPPEEEKGSQLLVELGALSLAPKRPRIRSAIALNQLRRPRWLYIRERAVAEVMSSTVGLASCTLFLR